MKTSSHCFRLPVGVVTGCVALILASLSGVAAQTNAQRGADGDGRVTVSGELKQWHKVTLDLAGPFARETDSNPNPFTDYRLTVTFAHESGTPAYNVHGYFAADGNAGETGAEAGNVWRAHLSPDKRGRWTYRVSFTSGPGVATEGGGAALARYDGRTGGFDIGPNNKTGRDFRAKGRLQYVGGHQLRFAGAGEYFLKAGPDSPETFLGSADFDNTVALKPNVPLKTWALHVCDWREGDPTWRGGRGKGIIGALNYLAAKGLNSFSFIPYNAGGDGDNVWPFVARDDKFHYDCSKLDQWEIVFAHAQLRGLYLHFKLQETENDDQRGGHDRKFISVPEALDGGALGPERKLYLRELIARFGHHLALNWNLGEENTQTPEEQRAMAQFIADTDPYGHHRVIHSYPNEQERVYEPLLGDQSALTGASLQNMWNDTHERTWHWVSASARAGKPWVVANDEQGPASFGVPPDPGYEGFNGTVGEGTNGYTLDDIRRCTLWGNLMAGGGGVEYYFGYRLPQNDLVAEDFRSRDRSWDFCRIALEFFAREKIPFWKMHNADELVGNPKRDNSRYCFALPGELYLVYLPYGGAVPLDLTNENGAFTVAWFNPREGGALQPGSGITGGASVPLRAPDTEDWLAVVHRAEAATPASDDSSDIARIVTEIRLPEIPDRDYVITNFGAKPGGQADARPAIQAAIKQAIADGGGRVVIPLGSWSSRGPIHLASRIDLHIAEGAMLLFSPEARHYLPTVPTRWEGTEMRGYSPLIYAAHVHDVAITGKGTFDGNADSEFLTWVAKAEEDVLTLRRSGVDGTPAEGRVFAEGTHLRPSMIQFFHAERVLLEDYTMLDSPFWANHLVYTDHATVRRIRVDSHHANNDGVDVDSSRHVLIEGCWFRTGDDSVVVKSGRDRDGREVGRPSEYVVVRRNDMGGEDGIALGSEVSGGIRHVHFTDNVLRRGASAIRFKANLDRGGTVEHIRVRNFTVESFDNLFWFQLNYPGLLGGGHPSTYRDIIFENFTVERAGTVFEAHAPAEAPLRDVTLRNITIRQADRTFVLENVKNLKLENVVIGGQRVDGRLDWRQTGP